MGYFGFNFQSPLPLWYKEGQHFTPFMDVWGKSYKVTKATKKNYTLVAGFIPPPHYFMRRVTFLFYFRTRVIYVHIVKVL